MRQWESYIGNHREHTHWEWDHAVHARSPTAANQTKSGTGQSLLQCCRNPFNPLHEAVEGTKGSRLGRGKSRMGQAEESIPTATCKYSSWQNSSKTRNGKSTQTDSRTSMRHSCQKTWEGTVENGQQAKQIPRSGSSFKKTASAGSHN